MISTMYVPAGVGVAPLDDPPPPQAGVARVASNSTAAMPARTANRGRRFSNAITLARPASNAGSSQRSRSPAGPTGGEGRVCRPGALPDPVVEIVRLEVTAAEPLGVTEPGEKLQVAPVGRALQESDTAALNPPIGVAVRV